LDFQVAKQVLSLHITVKVSRLMSAENIWTKNKAQLR
jgi:hypothetical protein